MVRYARAQGVDMICSNDTDVNPNYFLDQNLEKLISSLYWDAKCGRAAAEYNLEEAGMIEMISGHVAGQMREGDNFWDDLRWTVTERGRWTGMADLERIILRDAPLEIALWDAKDEAADVAGGCGGCEPGDSFLLKHQRILAHLEERAERILAAEKGREGCST
jgi:hypothetical protein